MLKCIIIYQIGLSWDQICRLIYLTKSVCSFLCIYYSLLLTNSGIPQQFGLPLFVICTQSLTNPKLSSPMYFFLHNLSVVDILYTTVTIPNMLSGLLTKTHTISVRGCFLQMYCFIQMAVTGRGILTVMAYDRYMAICNPLHYTAVMTRPVRCILIAAAWGFGAICSLPGTAPSWRKTYCGPNVVRHGWCDPSSVRRLVCGDTYSDNILSLSSALVALLLTGVLILTSYVLIGLSLSKMNRAERLKAFATCAAHLTVVFISYGSASVVYISYRVGNFPAEVRGQLSMHTLCCNLDFIIIIKKCWRMLDHKVGSLTSISSLFLRITKR